MSMISGESQLVEPVFGSPSVAVTLAVSGGLVVGLTLESGRG